MIEPKRPAKPRLMKRNVKGNPQDRYVALLLFQFRVVVGRESSKRRTVEKRMIVVHAPNAKQALNRATKRGREAQFDYLNSDGNPVHFEFVGVLDLLQLGAECEPDEVWYDICTMLSPMERRDSLLPSEAVLQARGAGRLTSARTSKVRT